MITTTENITNVHFSGGATGTIAIGAFFNGVNGNIILQEIMQGKGKSIGETLTQEEIQALPKVLLNFHSAKSIDVLIEQLKWLKNKLDGSDDFGFAMAC